MSDKTVPGVLDCVLARDMRDSPAFSPSDSSHERKRGPLSHQMEGRRCKGGRGRGVGGKKVGPHRGITPENCRNFIISQKACAPLQI